MNGLTRQRAVRGAALTAVCAGVIVGGTALVFSAGASAQDPPGNNGTVKIDDQLIDDIPNNNPHVGCVFRVDFYGFDEGVGEATVTFEMQAPTQDVGLSVAGDTSPDIGEDPAGGGNDLDASVTYTLTFDGEPQPQQGYHVRLTVNAPGSQGADVKQKVFWVEECPPVEPTPTPTPPPTEPPPTEPPPTEPPPTEPPPTEPPPTEPPPTEAPPTEAPPTEAPPTKAPSPQPPPTEIAAGMSSTADGSASASWWPVLLILGAFLVGSGAFVLRRHGVQ